MPFTPSHAIVALPFARTYTGLAAAVAVGAMTPDLPLFVRHIPLTYWMTHSWAWVPLTTLVAGALLAIWWLFIRPAVGELAPRRIAERLPGEWGQRFRLEKPAITVPLLVIGLAFGVATHIVWDSFTHEGRSGVVAFGLDATWGPLLAYKWLQYGSSVVGVAILVTAGILWMRRRTPVPVVRVLPRVVRVAWWVSLPVITLIAWIIGVLATGAPGYELSPEFFAYGYTPRAVLVWVILSLILCGVVHVRRRAMVAGRAERPTTDA